MIFLGYNLDNKMLSKKRLFKYFLGIFFVSFFVNFNYGYSASWDVLANDRFGSMSNVEYKSIKVNPGTGELYVAYSKNGSPSYVAVKKYSTTTDSWVQVGSDVSPLYGDYVTLDFNPTTYEPWVAYSDVETRGVAMAGRVTVKRYDGSSWVIVDDTGVGGVTASAEFLTLAISPYDNKAYIAYRDYGASNKISVKRYDGSGDPTGWNTLGTRGFSSTIYPVSVSLAFSSTTHEPYVAYAEYDAGVTSLKSVVKLFNGTSWDTVGTERFSSGDVDYLTIAVSPTTGEPYVAYKDTSAGSKMTVQKFNGTSWTTVGTAGFSYGTSTIDGVKILFHVSSSLPYVAYEGGVMKFDGSTWVPVGSQWFSAGSYKKGGVAFGTSTADLYVVDLEYVKQLTDAPSAPYFSPDSSNFYTSSISVTLDFETSGASIYYTTDGSTPTAASTLYSAPFTISASTTVKAIAIKSGYQDSDVVTKFYEKKVGAEWTLVGGSLGVSASYSPIVKVSGYSGEPYLVKPAGLNMTVQRFNGTDWIDVGTPAFVPETMTYGSYNIAIDPSSGVPYVSYMTNYSNFRNARNKVMRYNSSSGTWEYVGGSSGIVNDWSFVEKLDFGPDGLLYMLGYDYSASPNKLFFKKFNGTSWVDVAGNINGEHGSFSFNPLTNEIYVAAVGGLSASFKLNVYVLSATSSWEIVGSMDIHDSVQKAFIDFDSSGTLYVASNDNSYYQENKVFKLNGSSWDETASFTPTYGLKLNGFYVDSSDRPIALLSLSDWSTPTHSTNVYKYEGGAWSNVGTSNFYEGVAGSEYYATMDVNATSSRVYVAIGGYSGGFVYVSPDVVSTPSALVSGGTYDNTQSVTLSSGTDGATIYYTTDGSTPTTSSAAYSSAITISSITTLKAIAVKDGVGESDVMSEMYLFKAATTTASITSGTFNSDQTVTLSSGTTGATIYYTTDGTTPSSASTEYTGAITIASSTTLKAVATKNLYGDSDVMTEVYTLQVATPTPSIAGGTYTGWQLVTLSSETDGVTFYYTTNGTTPTSTSTSYIGSITISSTTTLRVIGIRSGYSDSGMMLETYNIDLSQLEFPTTATTTGTYNNDLSITLTSVTSGTTIYYTIDGSIPTASSNEYSTAISISTSTTLKAIAIKDGYIDSNVMTETYTFQVATPILSISGGTFTSNQSLTITSSTVGATIYYTTDGTTPTISSNLYTTAINIATTTTLKAVAIRSGYSNSSISSETYTIKVNVPIASPVGTSSSSTISVTLTSTTTGATIYYTTDGSTPTASSNEYSTAISITSSTTLKAIAIKSGLLDSNIMTETYTIFSKVATPTASPVGSSSSSTVSVTLTSTTTSATIYYTTDGSIPTTSSTQYSVPISISSSAVLKAVAVKDGYTNSDVMEESYTIFGQVIAPTASPGGSNSSSTISVVLSSGTSDSAIYYTIDGSTPTQSSTQYTGSILVSSTTATTTIKAIAIKDGHTNSNIMSEEYFVYPKVATPTVSTSGGFYTTTKTTTLSVETAGATIYYTTDGTTPTRSSTQYSSETINISTTTQLKAIAVLDNYTNSELLTENYSINLSGTSTILSNNYTISNTSNSSGTITNIPYGISKAIFMSALRKGQDDQTWNVSLVSDPVVTGNTIVVTAQDGINQRTYTLNVLTLSSNQATTSSDGSSTIDATTTQVVITDTTKQFSVSVSTSTSNPTINLGSLIVNGTGTLPSIIISSSNANNVVVVIATSTVVTSASTTWNGVINAPATTTVTLPTESGQTKTLSTAIEVGVVGEVVVFSKAVRILLPNQAGKRAGYIATSTFTEITSTCSSDSQTMGDALSDGGECKIDSGSDLVIWTKHFTTFATYTQTATPVVSSGGGSGASYFSYGGGGGGWGYSYSAPVVTTSNVTTSNIVAVLPLTKITNTNQISSSNTSVSNQINTNQILSVGSSGKDVEALQNFLYNEGYLTATPNGYFGKGTEKAVKIFQSKYADELLIPNGFKNPTGMVGESTRSKINELLNTTNINTNKNIQQEVASSKTVNTTDILSFGSKGDNVLSLQKSLYSLGYLTVTPNGYFGKATEKAVKSLQNKYADELLTPSGFSKPTGMVGEATRGKIDELISSNTLTKITNTNQTSSSNTSVSNQINTNQILSVGSSGKDVEALQNFLYNEGYLTATPNGYFGKGTEKAVKIFQSKYADELLIPNGFKNPTGMVGESTRSKINELIELGR